MLLRCESLEPPMSQLGSTSAVSGFLRHGCFTPVSSIGQCNTSCSLLAGVSKAKVFRGR